tara:strand:+ start:369 stop:587 length:219 start_codon:yes stop_codon:yes gene_type:complete
MVQDRAELQREGLEYLLMTHYNMSLKEVRDMNIDDAKQLLYWAQALQGEEEASGSAVYLGYNHVPPLEASKW